MKEDYKQSIQEMKVNKVDITKIAIRIKESFNKRKNMTK